MRHDVDDETRTPRASTPGTNQNLRMFAYDEESRFHWFDPAARRTRKSLARSLFGVKCWPPHTTAWSRRRAAPLRVSPFGARTTRADAGRFREPPRVSGARPRSAPRARGSGAVGGGVLVGRSPADARVASTRRDGGRRTRLEPRARGRAHPGDGVESRGVRASIRGAHASWGAVAAPLDAVRRGFRRVAAGPALGLFTAEELELPIRANRNWTWRHFDA